MSKTIAKTGNEALDTAISGFIPTFASEVDIRIIKDISKLHGKLKTINIDSFRSLEKIQNGKDLTPKMREIQRDEGLLLRTIIGRNMDF